MLSGTSSTAGGRSSFYPGNLNTTVDRTEYRTEYPFANVSTSQVKKTIANIDEFIYSNMMQTPDKEGVSLLALVQSQNDIVPKTVNSFREYQ